MPIAAYVLGTSARMQGIINRFFVNEIAKCGPEFCGSRDKERGQRLGQTVVECREVMTSAGIAGLSDYRTRRTQSLNLKQTAWTPAA